MSRSGTSRTSPTGPMPSTGCSWSSAFIACMPTVSADAAAQPALRPAQRARLRAHRAVVAAPEEADEPEAGGLGSVDDLVGLHGTKSHGSGRFAASASVAARAARCLAGKPRPPDETPLALIKDRDIDLDRLMERSRTANCQNRRRPGRSSDAGSNSRPEGRRVVWTSTAGSSSSGRPQDNDFCEIVTGVSLLMEQRPRQRDW